MRWNTLLALTAALASVPYLRAEPGTSDEDKQEPAAQTLEGTFEIELGAEASGDRLPAGGKLNGKWRVTLASPLTTALVPIPQPVLQVVVVPAASLSVDARPLGEAAATQVALAPGRHVVELSHPDFVPLRRTLTLLPGQTQRLVVDLAEEAVRKRR